MIINRVWAMPNKWTFRIPPIAELVARYVGDGKGWIDPFAGMYSPAEITNDLNVDMPTEYHLDALDFVKQLDGENPLGVIFDPPYSYRQVKECYEGVGRKCTQEDTSTRFYTRVMNIIAPMIQTGGYALSFGWSSNGFVLRRGFEIIEVLLVAHGWHHNDTICTVERKIQKSMEFNV